MQRRNHLFNPPHSLILRITMLAGAFAVPAKGQWTGLVGSVNELRFETGAFGEIQTAMEPIIAERYTNFCVHGGPYIPAEGFSWNSNGDDWSGEYASVFTLGVERQAIGYRAITKWAEGSGIVGRGGWIEGFYQSYWRLFMLNVAHVGNKISFRLRATVPEGNSADFTIGVQVTNESTGESVVCIGESETIRGPVVDRVINIRAFGRTANGGNDLVNTISSTALFVIQLYGPNNADGTIVVESANVDSIELFCDGDVDGDGAVGLPDLSLLLASFGAQLDEVEYEGHADFNQNESVGLEDLATLLSAFGEPC